MELFASLLPALLLTATAACAETTDRTNSGIENMTENQNCTLALDFSSEAEISNWRILLDGVMGGRSTGSRYAEGEHMTFKGVINTDGGGFSSMRRDMEPGELAGAETLTLRVKQDGRAYKLTFRTNARHFGRLVSYELNIPATPENEWTEVTLPLSGFETSVFGRTVRAKPFAAEDVREMGIILADGVDGPFEFGLRSLACS